MTSCRGRIQFRLWQTAWLSIGPVIAYAFLALAAVQQLGSSDRNIIDLGAAGWIIMLFLLGVRNAWQLLVEGSAPVKTT